MSVDLGQHFLTDREVLRDIVTAADLTSDDVVLEIGPGKGVLTEELAKKAKQVIAVELDRSLVAELQKKFRDQKNVTVVHEDILRWWPTHQSQSFGAGQGPNYFKVVANIPYRITAPILRLFLEQETRPVLMVLMTQKEVAERVCAKPGAMSMLSVSVQYYAKPEIVRIVPRTAFDPPPNVDSAILKILPFTKYDYLEVRRSPACRQAGTKIDNAFFRLAKIGFSSRRKQLQNLLAVGFHISNEEAKKALTDAGLLPTVRAQELSIDDWKKLCAIVQHRVL
ncbi:MAG: 16S rRNA (adenine(1518)-N(6)/adenine(1519)-N(6))-dimethyltransferase RsmA [bacterium]|nr:16S rRNA (adenine(1518)-N(6)/adenine(1519)-N(6))-dimethyltransferase RsmA [bacterium]